MIPWVDVATGSLGQGLPIGVGIALAGKKLDRLPYRVWVPLRRQRDGRGLDVGGVRARGVLRARQPDRDHRRQPARPARRDDARLGPRLLRRPRRARSAGTRSRSTGTTSRRSTARTRRPSRRPAGRPSIVARTIKGKGVEAVEDKDGWHGKALDDTPRRRSRSSAAMRNIVVDVPKPEPASRTASRRGRSSCRATRSARSRDPEGVRRRARRARQGGGNVVALDGEVSNSTYAEIFAKELPERYFEMFIAEQQMVAAAVGMQVRGWKPFASTFAAFLSRAYDFVRMAAISRDADAVRLARRRVDRRGRPVADGARGPRRVPRGARLDGALPLRREPDREARRARWPTSTASRSSARRAPPRR